MPDNDGVQRYELLITASGVVKDKDGNVVSNEPIEARAILTEDQLRAHLEVMSTEEKP